MTKPCPTCEGSGVCADCKGTKKVECDECDGEGTIYCECECGHEHERECRTCRGDGTVDCEACILNPGVCHPCKGTGIARVADAELESQGQLTLLEVAS